MASGKSAAGFARSPLGCEGREAASGGSGATGVQAIPDQAVVADQRRLGEQRQLFGVVEREPQTIRSVPDA